MNINAFFTRKLVVLATAFSNVALLSPVTMPQGVVRVRMENPSNESMSFRLVDSNGKVIINSSLRGIRTDERPIGATIQVQCGQEWQTIGTISPQSSQNSFTLSCR